MPARPDRSAPIVALCVAAGAAAALYGVGRRAPGAAAFAAVVGSLIAAAVALGRQTPAPTPEQLAATIRHGATVYRGPARWHPVTTYIHAAGIALALAVGLATRPERPVGHVAHAWFGMLLACSVWAIVHLYLALIRARHGLHLTPDGLMIRGDAVIPWSGIHALIPTRGGYAIAFDAPHAHGLRLLPADHDSDLPDLIAALSPGCQVQELTP